MWVARRQTLEIFLVDSQDQTSALFGRCSDDMSIGKVFRTQSRGREHTAYPASKQSIRIADHETRLTRQKGIESVTMTGTAIELGENDCRDDDRPTKPTRRPQGSANLFLATTDTANQRRYRTRIEDEATRHDSSN